MIRRWKNRKILNNGNRFSEFKSWISESTNKIERKNFFVVLIFFHLIVSKSKETDIELLIIVILNEFLEFHHSTNLNTFKELIVPLFFCACRVLLLSPYSSLK